MLTFIDLFAGAGGLSEGFVREGFKPIAHVEIDKHACDTLQTRIAYHFLKTNKQKNSYDLYLMGKISRDSLLRKVPDVLFDSVINTEISKTNLDSIFSKIDSINNSGSVDLVIGGPPCQAYSIIGRARDPQNMEHDKRNFLYEQYVAFLNKYQPKVFVFENVPGILSAKNGEHFANIKKSINKAGYTVDYKILDAKDFGVLQSRKRVILIGWLTGLSLNYPNFKPINNQWKVLNDLFYDLPSLKPGEIPKISYYTNPINDYLRKSKIRNGNDFTVQHEARPHNSRDLEIYKIAIEKWKNERKRLNYAELPDRLKTHKNQTSFLNRFQVVDPDGYSHTVVAHISCDGHYYIYPDFDLKQIRSISVREAARIQSFPDDYFFEGGRTAAYKQIGNAVPPLMASEIAKKIKGMLKNEGVNSLGSLFA